jgi:hypothetical protein
LHSRALETFAVAGVIAAASVVGGLASLGKVDKVSRLSYRLKK